MPMGKVFHSIPAQYTFPL